MHEQALKGAHTSYKARGKKEKQEDLFPELLKVMEKKRAERSHGAQHSAEDRFGAAFKQELAKLSADRIGGTPEEQRMFFDRVIAKYPDVYWIDGCPPPTVKSKLIHFKLKPGVSIRRLEGRVPCGGECP